MNLVTVAKILGESYNKNELETAFKTTTRIFIANNYDFLLEQRISRMELDLVKLKSYHKDQIASMCAVPFANKAIYFKFRESLIEEVQQIMDALIWTERLHQDEIEQRMNIKIYDVTERKMWSNYVETQYTIKKDFLIFRVENSSGWYAQKPEFLLSLPPSLRRVLAQYYEKPKSAEIVALETTTPVNQLYVTGEQDIQIEWARIITYINQDQLVTTAKGRPTVASINKMQRKLNLKEFFDGDHIDKTIKNIRSTLIAGMVIGVKSKLIDQAIEFPEMMRSILFRHHYLNSVETATLVLHYLKGINYIDGDSLPAVESTMLKILQKLPQKSWVSLKNIEDYMLYNVIEVKPILEHTVADKLYYQYIDPQSKYYNDKHYIRSGKYKRAIVESFIKGTFFLYASFGLVDIGYDIPDVSTPGVTSFSPYDGLKFVRRTPLGDYVLGFTGSYVPPKNIGNYEIKLSEDSLSIIVNEQDEAVSALISPYAERISPTRFQTDFRLFLKECRSKEELDTKIKLFQQFIGNELPPIWENFFIDLRQKIDPLEELQEIRIFKIPEANTKLVHLIARDQSLKKLVIKAEGYHVLISKEHYSKFKKRLQEFGYFITN